VDREALEGLTRKALVDRAKELGLSGYSALGKADLVDAVLAAEKPAKTGKKSKVVPAAAVEKTVPAAPRRDSAATAKVVAAAAKRGGEAEKPAAGEASPGGSRQDAGGPRPKAADKPKAVSEKVASKQAPGTAAVPAAPKVKAKAAKAEAAAKKPVSKESPGTAAVPAAPKGKAKAVQAAKEPRFKPAEAYLDGQDDAGETPAVAAGGAAAEPQFKKTSKVDDLLDVDTALGELPPSYDENRAVLLVRDPQWAYAYWDLSRTLAESAKGDYRQILRVQELSGAAGRPAYFFDVQVPRHARSWYLKLPGDGRRYRVEVGLHYRDGSFVSAARSNEIEMPRAKPSEVVADRFVTLPLPEEEAPAAPPQQQSHLPPVAEWMVAPESAGVRAAAAAPPAAPAVGAPAPTRGFEPAAIPAGGWEETDIRPWTNPWSGSHPLAPELVPGAPGLSGPVSSHAVTSWGFAPGASEEMQAPRPRPKDFWLVADAELIVYGATEPDAKVTLRGETVQLRPDGTFSFRFYLPDGLHPIPIRAINADDDDERMITITVSRQTDGDGKTNLRR